MSESAVNTRDKSMSKPVPVAAENGAPASPAPSAEPDSEDRASSTVEAVASVDAAGSLTPTEVRARDVVRSYVGWSASAGFLPMPFLDLAAVVGAQLTMLSSIAKVYDLKFDRKIVRPLLVALISSGGAYALAAPAMSLLKLVPVFGSIAGSFSLPALSSASCYATGRVFIAHFESGGTFLNFDPSKMRAFYSQMFAEAKPA